MSKMEFIPNCQRYFMRYPSIRSCQEISRSTDSIILLFRTSNCSENWCLSSSAAEHLSRFKTIWWFKHQSYQIVFKFVTGISAALLLRHMLNFKAIRYFKLLILLLWEPTRSYHKKSQRILRHTTGELKSYLIVTTCNCLHQPMVEMT